MLKIVKYKNYKAFDFYVSKHKNCTYSDLHNISNNNKNEINNKKLVISELRNSIFNEQHGLCCYCCKKVNIENSVIEHIIPQSLKPNISLQYENILLSCNSKETCNFNKANRYDVKLFISPLDNDCENFFLLIFLLVKFYQEVLMIKKQNIRFLF